MVTSADKLRYDAMFKQADKDTDGLVSGTDIYSNNNLFLECNQDADQDS